jgi:hypothetical protein
VPNPNDLVLGVPKADLAFFTGTNSYGCTPLAQDACAVPGQLVHIASLTPPGPKLILEIRAGGTADLLLYVDPPVPSTVAVAAMTVHWVGPNGGQDVSVPIAGQ